METIAVVRLFAAQVIQRHRLAPGDAQQEIFLAAYRRAGQAGPALDDDGGGVPRDRLAGDNPSAFFVTVVHGPGPSSGAGKGAEISPWPLAPLPCPGPPPR